MMDSTAPLLKPGVSTQCPGVSTNGSPAWLVIVWTPPHSLHIPATCVSARDYSDDHSLGVLCLALKSFLCECEAQASAKIHEDLFSGCWGTFPAHIPFLWNAALNIQPFWLPWALLFYLIEATGPCLGWPHSPEAASRQNSKVIMGRPLNTHLLNY